MTSSKHVLALVLAGLLISPLAASPANAQPIRATSQASYRNPVTASFADTFADPSVIQGLDGWWYAYSTADPLKAGDEPGVMHIARTKDWVHWDYRGTVFTDANRPSWASAESGLWAPDIRYVQGRYVLYYTVTDTTLNPGEDSAIGVATAPTPEGPWTPGGTPVVAPRPKGEDFLWTFDPAGFVDVNGDRYLYYGSYFGGIWGTRVSADGLRAVGEPTQVAIDNRYEGAYVIRHGGWYYLTGSAANCCAGPTTGYSVFAGRSRSPLGPFVDADGIALTASAVGGTAVVTQNGNRWIGAGHHAFFTDTSGQTYAAYHAIDRFEPWLDEPFGINRRPMLVDRVDWTGGWPRVRSGAGPSAGHQPAPVTGSGLGLDPADPAAKGWRGLRRGTADEQAGATAVVAGTATTRRPLTGSSVRVRLDVRTDRRLTISLGNRSRPVRVRVDPVRRELVLTARVGRTTYRKVDELPAVAGWQSLVISAQRGRVTAQVGESDLADPAAEVVLARSGLRLSRGPLTLHSHEALVDNVSVRPLADDSCGTVAAPQVGRLLAADEFDGHGDLGWSWVRQAADAVETDGQLMWPLQAADLVGTANNAGVRLAVTPQGARSDRDWVAETKVHLDLGTVAERNFQQAGLVAYVDDDDFARLSSVAIYDTRQTEFGRELVATADGRTSYGGAAIGTPAATTWLRLAHHRDAAGEQLYRAGTSRDGRHWTWGAVWTFPAGSSPRIGLVAHGGSLPAVDAQFDYLRFYAASGVIAR